MAISIVDQEHLTWGDIAEAVEMWRRSHSRWNTLFDSGRWFNAEGMPTVMHDLVRLLDVNHPQWDRPSTSKAWRQEPLPEYCLIALDVIIADRARRKSWSSQSRGSYSFKIMRVLSQNVDKVRARLQREAAQAQEQKAAAREAAVAAIAAAAPVVERVAGEEYKEVEAPPAAPAQRAFLSEAKGDALSAAQPAREEGSSEALTEAQVKSLLDEMCQNSDSKGDVIRAWVSAVRMVQTHSTDLKTKDYQDQWVNTPDNFRVIIRFRNHSTTVATVDALKGTVPQIVAIYQWAKQHDRLPDFYRAFNIGGDCLESCLIGVINWHRRQLQPQHQETLAALKRLYGAATNDKARATLEGLMFVQNNIEWLKSRVGSLTWVTTEHNFSIAFHLESQPTASAVQDVFLRLVQGVLNIYQWAEENRRVKEFYDQFNFGEGCMEALTNRILTWYERQVQGRKPRFSTLIGEFLQIARSYITAFKLPDTLDTATDLMYRFCGERDCEAEGEEEEQYCPENKLTREAIRNYIWVTVYQWMDDPLPPVQSRAEEVSKETTRHPANGFKTKAFLSFMILLLAGAVVTIALMATPGGVIFKELLLSHKATLGARGIKLGLAIYGLLLLVLGSIALRRPALPTAVAAEAPAGAARPAGDIPPLPPLPAPVAPAAGGGGVGLYLIGGGDVPAAPAAAPAADGVMPLPVLERQPPIAPHVAAAEAAEAAAAEAAIAAAPPDPNDSDADDEDEDEDDRAPRRRLGR